MTRRSFIGGLAGGVAGLLFADLLLAGRVVSGEEQTLVVKKIFKSEAEWRDILTPEQFRILRKEGTERPYTSPLLKNKQPGIYACAGCDLPLFTSEMKYDSGTGWPSFLTHIEGRVETKQDFKWIAPRTEYHCARCGGHQGHVFRDGPPPTYQRWCNNGVALKFIPSASPS